MKGWMFAAIVMLFALAYVIVNNVGETTQPAAKNVKLLPRAPGEQKNTANGDKHDEQFKAQRPRSLTLPDEVEIVIPRGPRKQWENRSQYSNRVNFTAKLDAFLAHVDLTEDEQHRLMLALYDYQEANQNIHAEWPRHVRDSIEMNEDIDRSYYRLMTDAEVEFLARLRAILTWGEERLWNIHCGACHMYLGYKGSILQKREAQ